jgi:hypothetical protein
MKPKKPIIQRVAASIAATVSDAQINDGLSPEAAVQALAVVAAINAGFCRLENAAGVRAAIAILTRAVDELEAAAARRGVSRETSASQGAAISGLDGAA